jgi:phage/plasmid-associated DNA primase
MSQAEIDTFPEDKRGLLRLKKDDIIKSILNQDELDGLLLKAIYGLDRLVANGDFTSSKTSEDTMRWWINNSDSLMGFCYDCIEEDPDGIMHKDLFRKEYQKYCRANKVPAESEVHVKETLTRVFHAWDYQESDGERVWGGIRLKNKITGITGVL